MFILTFLKKIICRLINIIYIHHNFLTYRPYTHVDTEGDIELETFELQEEDLVDKVKNIRLSNFYEK